MLEVNGKQFDIPKSEFIKPINSVLKMADLNSFLKINPKSNPEIVNNLKSPNQKNPKSKYFFNYS